MKTTARAVIERVTALGLSGFNAYAHRPMMWLGGKRRTLAECEAWLDGYEAGREACEPLVRDLGGY